ncbi:MAG TPA: hypothetical protein PLZ24_16805 [Flavobacteriales bacterium]|nr:hypothetical protein [Flavobacteriales bacterium]
MGYSNTKKQRTKAMSTEKADILLRKYQELRVVQKAFFKTRDGSKLAEAKNMERDLDKEVQQYFDERYGVQQGLVL